jgi:geranylgeranyl pyrophosphate synthase
MVAYSAAAAFGVPARDLLPAATACALLHEASLIHDDLQDGDDRRRGKDALWAAVGHEQAITLGDLLLVLTPLALVESADTSALTVATARRAAATAAGQAREFALIESPHIPSWYAYADVARGKSGHLFALPIEAAALAAGCGPGEAAVLGDSATTLGLLYQIVDDVVDLFLDKGRGRPGNDLREGKYSALIVGHLSQHPDDGPWLREILDATEVSPQTVSQVASRFRSMGTVHLLHQRALDAHATLAREEAWDRWPSARTLLRALGTELLSALQRAVTANAAPHPVAKLQPGDHV